MPTYATWNPLDKSTKIVLSNGDLTTTHGAGDSWESIRSNISVTSGKWYWELTGTWTTPGIMGIANSSAPIQSNFIGNTADGWGYYGATGGKTHSGLVAYGATFATGAVIGVALDMDGGTIEFFKNNVSQGQAFTGITGTIFAACSLFSANDVTTANFGATALTYTPPTGYNAGLFSVVAPVADFTGTPLSGAASLSVVFTDSSTNIPTSWLWEKNSGSGWVNFTSTPTAQNPTESFAAGTWSVRLTATNAAGSNTKTRTDYVVSTAVPVADFSGTPLTGTAPLSVAFTDSSTNTPTSWAWTFGDAQTSTSQNPTNIYASAGTYTVGLTATNAAGSDLETKTNYISVSAASYTKTGTGGIDPVSGGKKTSKIITRNIVKPTGLHLPNKKIDSSVQKRIDETAVLQAEIAEKLSKEFSEGVREEAKALEAQEAKEEIDATEKQRIIQAEIDREIGILLRKKLRIQEEQILILLMCA